MYNVEGECSTSKRWIRPAKTGVGVDEQCYIRAHKALPELSKDAHPDGTDSSSRRSRRRCTSAPPRSAHDPRIRKDAEAYQGKAQARWRVLSALYGYREHVVNTATHLVHHLDADVRANIRMRRGGHGRKLATSDRVQKLIRPYREEDAGMTTHQRITTPRGKGSKGV
eukprot:scaffold1954_cov268-Pinguiococcus_pyrenoidosus.AAC.29